MRTQPSNADGRPSNADGRRRFIQNAAALALAACAGPAARGEAADPGAGKWLIGCFTRPFGDFSFAETLQGIAQAGYRAVGLMSIRLPEGAITLADASKEQALTVAGMASENRLEIIATYYDGPPVQSSLREGVAALRKLIDNCVSARCGSILMGGTTDEQLYDRYYQAIAELCDYAAERNVALTLKPHGGSNATGPQCREAIARVGHPSFKLWYDPGNIYYYSDGELDPVKDAATVDGLVTGMCVKDFQPPKEVAINPGTGKVDFPRVLQTLQAGGFTAGPLVVETLAPGDLATTIANARDARRLLQRWVSSD